MSDLISPGQRIRHYRMLLGMTQKALGIAAGFPPETADIRIAQYESCLLYTSIRSWSRTSAATSARTASFPL